MGFILLDKITNFKPNESAEAIKCVSLSDDVLRDHFPGMPIFPGNLITEGLAQLCGFLLETSLGLHSSVPPRFVVLVQVENMKFSNLSYPGDVLTYSVQILSLFDTGAILDVTATCEGQKRAQGRLQFLITELNLTESGSKQVLEHMRQIDAIWTYHLQKA